MTAMAPHIPSRRFGIAAGPTGDRHALLVGGLGVWGDGGRRRTWRGVEEDGLPALATDIEDAWGQLDAITEAALPPEERARRQAAHQAEAQERADAEATRQGMRLARWRQYRAIAERVEAATREAALSAVGPRRLRLALRYVEQVRDAVRLETAWAPESDDYARAVAREELAQQHLALVLVEEEATDRSRVQPRTAARALALQPLLLLDSSLVVWSWQGSL